MGVRMAAVSLACQCILLVTTCLFVSGPDMGGSTSDRPQNLRSTLFEPHGGVTTNRRLLQDTSTSGNDNSSSGNNTGSSSPFPGDTPPDQNTRFIPSYPSPNSNNTAESNPTAKNVAIICSVIGVLIILVVLVYCFVRFRGRRQNGKLPVPGKVKNGVVSLPPSTSVNNREIRDTVTPRLTSTMIKDVTGNFREMIGEGAFGIVYLGNWQGKKIAVKRLKEVLDISAEDFEREIGILMKVKHRNLVKLVAYCNDDRYRYLCFEYLSGGSLDKLLYASKHNEGSILLDWSRRYHIIKEVCTGLYYLHEESDSEEKILHMDLKAGNVLIDQKSDGNLVVKIADFGTSRLLKADKKHDYITGQLIGPRFYLPPECFQRGKISEKADVYSFGMLLLEMITGWCAGKQESFPGVDNFMKMGRRALSSGNVRELLDPRLGAKDCSVPQVLNCIDIANDCLNHLPEGRPDTKKIAERLARC